jgi:Tfp pilus assembly protein FimT
MFKNLIKKLKRCNGQSLAEFAVTTAMMATLATTAAPKFSGVGEGAKEKKTLSDIDKIKSSANNFYNAKVTSDGRGRFPGQNKYNQTVPETGGYATEVLLLADIKGANATFTTYTSDDASSWASVYSTDHADATAPSGHQISNTEDDNGDGSFDEFVGAEEFLNEFGGNPIKSPFQDGHYIYTVIAGSGSGTSSVSPILYIADLESPKNFYKKLQP